MAPDNDTLGGITRETFESLQDSQKLVVLYDLLVKQCGDCKRRLCALEASQIKNTTFASGAGLIGGFLAMFTKKLFDQP